MSSLPNEDLKQLKIPCELGAEKIAIRAASTMAKTMGFDDERIADIRLAMAEACTNAIEHGSAAHNAADINIVLRVDGDKLDMCIQNPDADVLPPDALRVPDIHKMVAGEDELGGMGLFLIKKLMDVAEFIESENGKGYQFHMVISHKDNPVK